MLKSLKSVLKFKQLSIYLSQGAFVRPFAIKILNTHKYNIGDTNKKFHAKGWSTIDIKDADYIVNVRNQATLPIDDQCADAIYTSHMIEHVSDEAVEHLFSEIYRVAKENAVLRVVCPDQDKAFNAYYNEDFSFFLRHDEFLISGVRSGLIHKDSLKLHNHLIRIFASYIGTGAGPIVTKEEAETQLALLDRREFARWCASLLEQDRLDENKLNWGHINAFDHLKVIDMLEAAGFRDIRVSSAGDFDKNLFNSKYFIDNENVKEWISLFIEAKK